MTNYEDVDYYLDGDDVVLITIPIKLSSLRVKTRVFLDRGDEGLFVEEVDAHDSDVTVKGYEGADIEITGKCLINAAVAKKWMDDQIPQEHTEGGYVEPEI